MERKLKDNEYMLGCASTRNLDDMIERYPNLKNYIIKEIETNFLNKKIYSIIVNDIKQFAIDVNSSIIYTPNDCNSFNGNCNELMIYDSYIE